MKPWPKGNAKVRTEDLVTPVLATLRKGYRLIRRNPSKAVPYDGYNIGDTELSSCLSPREALSRKGLQRAKENGRSLLEVALYIAFQLGMEQGRRQAARDRVD